MLKRLGPLPRFLLALMGLLVLLALMAGLWFWLPASPRDTFASSRGPCNDIQIAGKGSTLVAIHPNTLPVWDLAGRRQLGVASYLERLDLLLSADGQTLAFGDKKELRGPARRPPSWDSVRTWQPASQPAPVTLPGMHSSFDLSADGQLLVTWTIEGGHQLWQTATGREERFPASFTYVKDIHLLRDNRLVVTEFIPSAGWLVDTGSIKLWTFNPDLTLASQPVHLPRVVGPVAISPDGRLVTFMKWEPEPHLIQFFDLRTGRELASVPRVGRSAGMLKPLFCPDGTRMVTEDQSVWDITVTPPRKLGSIDDGLRVDFSPDGKWLRGWPCPVGPFETEAIFDVGTIEKQPVRTDVGELTFAPDSRTIAGRDTVTPTPLQQWLASWLPWYAKPAPYEALQVWTYPDWRQIASFPNSRSFAYIPDGQAIAIGRDDGTVEIWDIPPRRPWWIEYGLPVIFILMLLLGARLIWLGFRRKAPEVAPC